MREEREASCVSTIDGGYAAEVLDSVVLELWGFDGRVVTITSKWIYQNNIDNVFAPLLTATRRNFSHLE